MTRSVRFIHAADLHLGAPIRGLRDVSPEWAARLERALADAYERLIEAALAREVDFVIIAGDAFDTARSSYCDYLKFFEGLERLDQAGIPVYLVAGNHDPYTLWARELDRLPASAHLLGVNGPEFALFTRKGEGEEEPLCLIGGRSYYNQTWSDAEDVAAGITRAAAEEALLPGNPDAAQAPFAVGIIHTGLELDHKKAPTSEVGLLSAGIDYWACGHVHKRMVRPSQANPRIVFPGCTQGRDIKETGERGCYLVELREGEEPQLELLPTSSVVLQQLKVDVSACQTLADIVRLAQTRLFHENGKAHCDEMVSRITLEGETPLHQFLVKPEVIADLRNHINNAYPSFFCDALENRTRMPNEGEIARSAGLFSAIVEDIADEQRVRRDVLINYAQSELVKRGIAVPDSLTRKIDVFNADAETFIRDLLREEPE